MNMFTKVFPVATLAMLLCSNSHALGLGDIKVVSHLNEPFLATIELTGTESISESDLLVQLASDADFKRAGVSRDTILLQLQFEPKLKQSPRVIQVTSQRPIREPSLDFLVDVQSPKGQFMKEYTVLLDPAK